MGFDWHANVEVVFGAEVQIPRHTARMVKRLALWQPPKNTLFEAAAKRVRLNEVPDSVRTRAEIASKQAVDYSEIPEDAEMSDFEWSDMPEEVDEETKEFLERLKELTSDCNGVPNYDPECAFDLDYNRHSYFNEAFQLAAKRLFCTEDHGIEITFEQGGSYGEVDNGASEQLMMLRSASKMNDACIDPPRGCVNGVPWGCFAMPIPTDVDVNKRDMINMAIKSFGFRVEKPVGWYLVTVASGG